MSVMSAFSPQAVAQLGGEGGTQYNQLEAEILKSPTLTNMINNFAAAGGIINIGVATGNSAADSDFAQSSGGGNNGAGPVINIAPELTDPLYNSSPWYFNIADGIAHEMGQFNNNYVSSVIDGVIYTNGLVAKSDSSQKSVIDGSNYDIYDQEGYGIAYEYLVAKELSQADNANYTILSGPKIQSEMDNTYNYAIATAGTENAVGVPLIISG